VTKNVGTFLVLSFLYCPIFLLLSFVHFGDFGGIFNNNQCVNQLWKLLKMMQTVFEKINILTFLGSQPLLIYTSHCRKRVFSEDRAVSPGWLLLVASGALKCH